MILFVYAQNIILYIDYRPSTISLVLNFNVRLHMLCIVYLYASILKVINEHKIMNTMK